MRDGTYKFVYIVWGAPGCCEREADSPTVWAQDQAAAGGQLVFEYVITAAECGVEMVVMYPVDSIDTGWI